MKKATLADGVPIDVQTLIETRLLVQCNSGGGKSWALRRILEQTAPHIQQLVIDPEGEFSSLREKFDYIIAAPYEADVVANPKTAALLARRLLESGASAVLDIYDLKLSDRQLFVKNFLEALINAPRRIWRPVLIILDEGQMFAPEKGAVTSTSAVIDMACRGRKRGQGLVCATQRLSKLHKDVAAEMLNKLVGRTGLDIDVKRAAQELGISAREAMKELRSLEPGNYFYFGPALSKTVECVKVGGVKTTHPEAGKRMMDAPPVPSKNIIKQLSKMDDLQKEAEKEAITIEELHESNNDLKRKLKTIEKQLKKNGVPESEVKRRISAAIIDERERAKKTNTPKQDKANKKLLADIRQKALQIAELAVLGPSPPPCPPTTKKASLDDSLTGPEQRILDAIAWLESLGIDQPEQPAVAFLAGYSVKGGAYNNPRGKLKRRGYVQYISGARIGLTDSGRLLANQPEKIATNQELHNRVLERLGGPERRLLQALLESYPSLMSNEDLAAASGYTVGAGAFNNPKGRLKSLGLIDYPRSGHAVAKSLLFPENQ